MEFGEYLAGAEKYRRENREQRRGQAYMNYLGIVRKDLYRFITGKIYDPFYDDSRMSNFMDCLMDYWDRDEVAELLDFCPVAITNYFPDSDVIHLETKDGSFIQVGKDEEGRVKVSITWYNDMDEQDTLIYTLGQEHPVVVTNSER